MSTETKYRICPLCEATCGLALEIEGRKVLSVRGDKEDAFSEGYLCPKGVAIQDLDADPDRLRHPLIREGETFREASWDEAFTLIESKLLPIIKEHGNSAVGVYAGNPGAHNASISMYSGVFLKALKTPNIFSASTVDQMPKQLSGGAMFGTGLSVPIPDLDRCQYLLIMGANPLESNGSLMTAPNVGERLKRIQKRGGKIVVLDPRLTKTAKLADAHHFIQPGSDAYFLCAMLNTIIEEDLVNPGRLEEHAVGFDEVRLLVEPFTPDVVAERCGISADAIRQIAREFSEASGAAIHARIGTCTQEFGTLSSWLPDVIHYATGNLDRVGGAMFPLASHGGATTKGKPGVGHGLRFGRHTSRVSGHPEILGELPAACLAEEIETEGEGQIRMLFVIAGNPLLSTVNTERLTRAIEGLEFMVSLDIYVNETSRHADVILPGLSPLEVPHFDPAFAQLAIQNHARYSPPVFDKPEDQPYEWETLLRLTGLVSGQGSDADVAALDDYVMLNAIEREAKPETSAIHGCDPRPILAQLAPRRGVERMVDFMLRTGPYGDGFGKDEDGLTLDQLEAHPHGIPFGALKPRIPEALRTPSGKIELAAEYIVADMARLSSRLDAENNGLVLVGRRHLRSNNSWLHNSKRLVNGKPRCTLQIHPDDAQNTGLSEGDSAEVASRVGKVQLPVEITDEIMRGVVSIPHGWGHDVEGVKMGIAQAHAGVNTNILTDGDMLDVPSGNAVLNGIPVTVQRA
jgi:anaerobic selenocysteine-containing dehydrogenase